MKKMFSIFALMLIVFSVVFSHESTEIMAQDIPELHMLIVQGDILINSAKSPSIDNLELTAKIGSSVVGSVIISNNTTTSRFNGLEIGPNEDLKGQNVTFWIGNEKATETVVFGPTTPSGTYCAGCSWVLPISSKVTLNFAKFPVATPTPVPATVLPTFISGNVIFGSMLSAPDSLTNLQAFIDGELVGTGSFNGSQFSITIDPGNVTYLGKQVIFKSGSYQAKTTFEFIDDGFITDFKLFFPEYIAPTATSTPIPPVLIPTATSTPEPTRTSTPTPQPTATYTATPTPTPIVLSTSSESDESSLILEDSDSGGCNSRGGGAASLSLIVLSAAPLYVLNRRRKK